MKECVRLWGLNNLSLPVNMLFCKNSRCKAARAASESGMRPTYSIGESQLENGYLVLDRMILYL